MDNLMTVAAGLISHETRRVETAEDLSAALEASFAEVGPSVIEADDPSVPRSNRLTAWDPVAQRPVWSAATRIIAASTAFG